VNPGYARIARKVLRALLIAIVIWLGLLAFAAVAMIGGQHP
jgi:hypothetical protein